MTIEPANLVALYDKVAITEMELQSRLIRSAAYFSPADIIKQVPLEFIESLRIESSSPPKDSEDCTRFFTPGIAARDFDHPLHELDERRTYLEGIWRWHCFFKTES